MNPNLLIHMGQTPHLIEIKDDLVKSGIRTKTRSELGVKPSVVLQKCTIVFIGAAL